MNAINTNRDVQSTAWSNREPGRVLMRVKGLRKSFGGQVVLDGVNFELREGEVVLLRGENGSGKTTLLNILTGNMEPDTGEIQLYVNGKPETFRFPRPWWRELNPWDHFTPERLASEGVGRTWQDVRLFGSQTLVDNLAVAGPNQPGEKTWRLLSGLKGWKKAEKENRREVLELLEKLGLGDRGDSSADMISLGQTKRLAFARSARTDSKIIFLDEPLAGLDKEGTENVLNALREIAVAHRLTLVIVEHVFNIPIILDFATSVWTLANGRLCRETVKKVKNESTAEGTHDLATLLRMAGGDGTSIIEEPLERGAFVTRFFQPDLEREPLLKIEGLIVKRGNRLVVGKEKNGERFGLNLTIHKGELAFLQAPNGWGKTSLLEALIGVLPCEAGEIKLSDSKLVGKSIWERRKCGMDVVLSRDNVFNSLTVSEFHRINGTGTGIKASETVIRKLYQNNGSSDREPRMMSSLSGGERKRLLIENAKRQKVLLRIWDEPFTSLDVEATKAFFRHTESEKECANLVLIPSNHSITGSRLMQIKNKGE